MGQIASTTCRSNPSPSPEVFHLIDDRDVSGRGLRVEMVNPADGTLIGSFNSADPADVDEAIAAARRTFVRGVWAKAPWAARQAVMRNAAHLIREHAARLAALQMRECGFPADKIRGHITSAATWFDHYADYLSQERGDLFGQLHNATASVSREPIGVCALFAPWNVPVGLAAAKLAPALAAGNSIILKPSELVPAVSRALVDLIREAGVPAGVLNLVNGAGHITGAALAEGDIDALSFTGGSAGGTSVALAAARRHVPVALELGGKSATIVFADADFDRAVAGALTSIYGLNGEACLAGSRILVQRAVADRFLAAFRRGAEEIVVGDPADPANSMGPMISAAHRDRVCAFFGHAAADGDTLLYGGKAIDRPGFYVTPTAYLIASTRSRVWREEVFGPIAAIRIFDDDDEAIGLANDSDFGLAAYIWTRNQARAYCLGRSIRAGTIFVNSTVRRDLNAPFGGYKQSGIGREGGRYGWEQFTEAKTVIVDHCAA